MSHFIDFLFPPSCPICNSRTMNHGEFCADCWSKFNWIGDPKCSVCGYPFPSNIDLGPKPLCPVCAIDKNEIDFARAACVYEDWSRNIMLPFKHSGALKYKDVMSNAMIGALRDVPNFDIVMPVPLAYLRLWKRGYNQATLLARPIARHFNKKLDVISVTRKYKPDMGHKTASQRAENIRGVFRIKHPENINGKKILLVDDVMTTGATFAELSKVLKRAGATSVYGVTFCRTVRAI